jgi:hypothetical protein
MPEKGDDVAVRQPDDSLSAETSREGAGAEPTNRFFYGLGLGLQTFLWFLLFLAIVVAVAVGNELTEFRYVGF